MKKPETVFKEKVQAELKKLPRVWFFKVDLVSVLGIPDIIGCVDGWFFAWELKKDNMTEPEVLQTYVLAKIKKAGAITAVVHPENFDKHYRRIQSIAHGKGKR